MIIEALSITVAQALVSKIATVGLKKLYKDVKADYEQHLVPLTKHFEDYLTRAYEHHSLMSTMVLRNSKRRLKDIYVPLTILEENNPEEKTVVERYSVEFMRKHPRMIIRDTAGMGKTTLVRRLFLSAVDEVLAIPIIVELRRISQKMTLLDIVYSQIDSLSEEFDHDLLLKLI